MPEASDLENFSEHRSTDPCIFLFVNPKSGGNAAGSLLQGGRDSYIIRGIKTHNATEIFTYDISAGKRPSKPGFLKLKDLIRRDPGKNYIVVTAGGDGTVMWCLSELEAHRINLNNITLSVMPFGTGNDFARALGWTLPSSFKPFHNNMAQLRNFVDDYCNGTPIYHDIWVVNYWVDPNEGSFLRVSSDDREKHEIRSDEGDLVKHLELKMCNYFSLGVESRIGIGFDKRRTESAFVNKIKYTTEGFKKALFTPTLTIRETLSDLQDEHVGKTIFSTVSKSEPQLCNALSLIASNIPSFAAGLDIWGNSSQAGIEGHTTETLPYLRFDQKMGDRKLEFVCFNSVSAFGAERTAGGNGKRVHQGHGPFHLTFLNDIDKMNKVYFQVDGEFYASRKPIKLKISHSNSIRVLAKTSNTNKPCYIIAQP